MTTYENPREFKCGIFMPNFKETEVNGIWKRQQLVLEYNHRKSLS